MQPELFNQQFNKLFSWYSSKTSPGLLTLELDLYKKLLNFFVTPDSFYFILNHHSISFDMVSTGVEDVLGYKPSEVSLEFLNEQLHRDDRPWFLTFGKCIIEIFSQIPVEKFTKYKMRHDVGYRKKDGDYARLLYQGLIVEHEANGRLLRSLGILSDITYLKQEGTPFLSVIGMEGEPSYIDVARKNIFIEGKDDLNTREKEILKLLITGKLSKEISSILHISKQTVDTHRKNMLRKKNLNSTGELVGKAIRYGWI